MRSRRTRRIVVAVVAVLATLFVAACEPAPDPPPPPPPASPAAQDMLVRHNYVRGINGIGALAVDGNLQANAQFHAERLAAGAPNCANLWHSGELGDWYGGFAYGENVACVPGCPEDAGRAINLWIASPAHAGSVFNPTYGFIGVGVACNGSVQAVVAHYRSP